MRDNARLIDLVLSLVTRELESKVIVGSRFQAEATLDWLLAECPGSQRDGDDVLLPNGQTIQVRVREAKKNTGHSE